MGSKKLMFIINMLDVGHVVVVAMTCRVNEVITTFLIFFIFFRYECRVVRAAMYCAYVD